MKKNIPISKISYLYKGWEPTDESVTYILQKPIYSYIESSYNSIVMMNVHNEGHSYEFNYLVFIDENGVGSPLYSVTSTPKTSDNKGAIAIYPRIEVNNLSYNAHNDELTLNTINEINSNVETLSSAVSNIVKVLNNKSVHTILGLNSSNKDAAANLNNALELVELVNDRYYISSDMAQESTQVETPK